MSKRVDVLLENEFHGSCVGVRIGLGDRISARRAKDWRRSLCCDDCLCSGPLGLRGPQPGLEAAGLSIREHWDRGKGEPFWTVIERVDPR
jgi:hypothetical protein